MVDEAYKGKAPLQYPLGSNIDAICSREGDEYAHLINISAEDSALHNSYMA